MIVILGACSKAETSKNDNETEETTDSKVNDSETKEPASTEEETQKETQFASRDFVKGRQDDLISINEYIYCRDDPNNYVDYNGLFVLTTLAIVGVGALVGAGVSATINAGTQAIKIHQGKQESFQWGSLAGSAVEGAIVGGVSAIPGVGATATIIGGVAGGAAKSTISQAIDKKSVNVLEVVEEGVVGGITSGIFYGIGNQAKKIKLSGKKPQKDTKELYKTAGESVSKKLKQIEVAKNATGRASPLRYRQLAQFETEAKGLLKKYACEKVKGGVKKGVESSVNTVFGIKTTKTIFKEVTKRFLPIYDDEETALEYLEDYFGTMYGKLDGRCPLYA